MKRNTLRLLAVMALAVQFVVPVPSAFAAVLWDTGTLREVYNPQGNLYAYAPAVILDGETKHMWMCHNAEDGVFKDHIYYTKIVNGAVVESRSVLQAGSEGSWDSFHVCDPSVIAGKFNYDGHEYDYAMFYTGNDVNGSHHNQIGVAFSDSLAGDWVKFPQPIVTYPNDGYWGVGQPSATSVDGLGRLLLFFTKGDPTSTGGFRIDLNLHDMSNPVIGPAVPLTNHGLAGTDGMPDWLNNFDMVYDPSRDRFYAVRETHPYPSNAPAYISISQQIVSISGGSVWGGGGEWKIEGTLSEAVTGHKRNHNAGLLRTAHGTLPQPDRIDVYFADSDADPDLAGRAEFTYDIWNMQGELNDNDPLIEIELNNIQSKHLSATRWVENLNTHRVELHGTTNLVDKRIWVGYRIFDQEGYLLEAGTAYRDRIAEDGSFTIPISKPAGTGDKRLRLEVYLLSPKGKLLDSAIGKTAF